MNRHIWHPLLLLAAAGALLSSCQGAFLPETTTARGGVLDLRGAAPPLVQLEGSWQAYPSALLYPVDFEQQTEGRSISRAPVPGGNAPFAAGYTTYRLRVFESPSSTYGGILVPRLGSAMELWVDGAKVGSEGQVGTSPREELANPKGILAFFAENGESTDIVLQVSDFHHAAAGQVYAPVLFGTARAVAGYEAAVRGLQLALLAVLALFLLLFLVRYLSRGRWGELRPLTAAAVCLAGAIRELVAYGLPGLSLAAPLAGALPWPLDLRAGVGSHLLLFVAYYLTFLRAGRGAAERISMRLLLGLAVAVTAASLFVPGSFVTPLAVASGALLSLGMLYLILRELGLGPGGPQVPAGSVGTQAAGHFVLLAAAVNGVLVSAGLSSLGYVAPLAVVVFAVLMAAGDETEPGATRGSGRGSDERELRLLTDEIDRSLHGIVGLAESLLAGRMGELGDEQVVSLSLIAASGLRVSRLASDFADRERLDRGTLQIAPKAVSLAPLVEQVSDQLAPLLLVRSVEIHRDFPADLPPVRGERAQVERIFYNLMAEALRRVERGTIEVSGRADRAMVEITMRSRETPGGGPEGGREAGGTTEGSPEPARSEGAREGALSRLGAEVAFSLVRLYGGRVVKRPGALERELHTVFTLPVATGAEEGGGEAPQRLTRLEELSAAEQEAGTEEKGREGLRVLIACDDLLALETMRNHLIREHYRVSAVFDGERALERVESSPPDMLLVSASLPKIDGLEVCRRVRKSHTSTELPVLILIDRDQRDSLEEGLSAGASDFIAKPISADEFLARVKTHINLAKMNTLYSRFVPVELLHFIGHENVVELELGDQIQREMTILFVDIRAFTNLSEAMTPEENFKFINSYLSRITPIIRENNGFIDKYIGDAILALYPNSPEDALRSAIRMVDYLQEYNGYRRNSGYRPIKIGIGIHTGNLIVGIIGDSARMQGTVISDAVNLASRVQDVTKLYGANIIISQETFIRLENPTAYNFRFLGRVKVKGKNQTVSLFEVFDGEPPEFVALKNRTKTDFEEAILLFSQRKFQDAAESFRKITNENPVDRAAALFLNRAEFFLRREKANWLLK